MTQTLRDVHITYADEKSINFDKKDLNIPRDVFKTVYISKFIKRMKDGKDTTELLKKGDIANIKLKIGDKFINIIGYNIIGHNEIKINTENLFNDLI